MTSNPIIRATLLFAVVSAVVGCSEYMDRKDTIAFNAGEAVARNELAQTPDPWPPYVGKKNFAVSGVVIEGAMQRYKCPPAAGGGGGGLVNITNITNNTQGAGTAPTGGSC